MSVLTIERHISGGLLVWLKYPAPVLREGSSDPRAPSDSGVSLQVTRMQEQQAKSGGKIVRESNKVLLLRCTKNHNVKLHCVTTCGSLIPPTNPQILDLRARSARTAAEKFA